LVVIADLPAMDVVRVGEGPDERDTIFDSL
jgi:hypothetical protein